MSGAGSIGAMGSFPRDGPWSGRPGMTRGGHAADGADVLWDALRRFRTERRSAIPSVGRRNGMQRANVLLWTRLSRVWRRLAMLGGRDARPGPARGVPSAPARARALPHPSPPPKLPRVAGARAA